MTLKLFNTKTQKLETFRPIDPNNVKIYTCGPTVYDYAHIGNFTSYIYWDLLLRTLMALNHKPNRILNFTDVGHLASDADEGIDKLEKGAKREGKSVWDIAKFYSNDFLRNFKSLNLIPPAKICPATNYIKAQINLVERLTEKGFTYETSDGVYFDTSKFPNYAKFARLDLDHLKAGARVKFSSEKKNPTDFAVWKFVQPDENHAMQWQYLNRPGYPGWHLECSAIIHSELGEPIDIHAGGIDHIPVHHTNEIAQSTAAFNSPIANYWIHCNFITINNEKISKSLGNTLSLDQLKAKGFTPLEFKTWVLQGHYQSERNFNFNSLTATKSRYLNWRNRVAAAFQSPISTPNPNFKSEIISTLSDNLNSASAFALIDNSNLTLSDWEFVDQLFGLDLLAAATPISQNQLSLINQRESARQVKDWSTADAIRDQLAKQNLTVKDTSNGPIWQFIS